MFFAWRQQSLFHVVSTAAFGTIEGRKRVYKFYMQRYVEGVGIATGYWREGPGSIPGMAFFSSPQRPDRLWVHPASYSMGSGGKAAGA
jgi:hypothetical protein